MSTSMWLRQLRKLLIAPQSKTRGRKPRPSTAQRRFRPCLEALEDRLVLDAVQTVAVSASAPFSEKSQNVTLTANVKDQTSSGTTVTEGKVTFTVIDPSNSKTIGTAAGNVTSKSNGQASATFGLPALTKVGSYTIDVAYTDAGGPNTDGGDTPSTLSVTAASTTTTAQNATATFNTKAEDVKLTASVSSDAGTVDEGKVKFTVVNGTGKAIGAAASGSVTKNGSASVSYGLPAFTNVGSYTIEASYSDSTGNFADSGNSTQSPKPALSVSAATTTTTAQNATATFSTSTQNVTLTANVTSSAGTVDEGKVKFTVVNSTGKNIGTASGTVTSSGSASGTMGLPAFTNVGSYTIEASYSDSTGNFAHSDNANQSPKPILTVSAATSTSLSLTSASIVPNASGSNAQVTLTAQVSNPNGVVNEGVVSFTLDGVTEQGNVSNGIATAQLSVPTSTLNLVSNVALSYSDSGGSGNFSDGSGSANLTTNFFNTTFSATLTYNSDGTVRIDMQLGGQTVLGFVYTAWGAPTEIDVASLTLPVTYTTLPGGDVLVSIDGKPWQLNLYDSSGQFLGLATLNLNADGSTNWILLNSSYQPIGTLPSS